MPSSVRSIRKRLLECLDRRELEKLSHWEQAPQRGRDTVIAYILEGRWSVECDDAIQGVVNQAKLGTLPKKVNTNGN
jgi:hypothetical protein